MSDRKSTDHWNVLAVELGAVPAAEVEKEQETPELPPSSDLSCADLVAEEPAEPSAGQDIEEAVEPGVETPVAQPSEDALKPAAAEVLEESAERPVEPEGPAKKVADDGPVHGEVGGPKQPVPQTASPQTVLPKRKLAKHWWDLASSLGVEVSEPEPELEPEPEPEAPSEPEVIREVEAVQSRATTVPAEPPGGTSASAPKPTDPVSRERAEPRRGHRRSSLFDDPGLSLDTPGVLDAVFDEGEPEPVSHRETAPERRQPDGWAEERRRSRPTAPEPRDSIFFDEPEDDAFDDVEPESEESAAAREADERDVGEEADRSDRSRGRRRRRGGRRGQRPASEEARFDPDSEDEADEDDRSAAPRRSSGAAELRERRAQTADELEDDLEDEGEDESEDRFDEEREEEGGGERLRLKHKKIPTWQQAVDAILAANMESRAKNPGGGAARGRGRRWRR